MTIRGNWTDRAKCRDLETNLFFDKYEEDIGIRNAVDALCSQCPVQRECLATAVSRTEWHTWGVWGGIYFEKGKFSKEFNSHKGNSGWSDTWISALMEKE